VEVREKEEEEEGRGKGRGWELVWDRKIEGGFPEMKVLVRFSCSLYMVFRREMSGLGADEGMFENMQKQRIRNLIAPKQDLGHSDKPGKTQ